MSIWRSVSGIVEVELTSAEPEVSLGSISSGGIEIRNARQTGPLTFCFSVRRADFRQLEMLCSRRGDRLRLIQKLGLHWTARRMLTRPVLSAGFLVLLLGTLWLPSRVLFIQVEGNAAIPASRILEAAEESGIRFWASRRLVRSERVKNALLSAVPELQWAGVNTAGCVATVSVRERRITEVTAPGPAVSSIVAARDGYILSGTVVQGDPRFRIGEAVQAGQLLISGYTDCGIAIQATRAQGEIYAQTKRELTAVMPSDCLLRGDKQQTGYKISLLLGKKRIFLWKDSGILDATCGRMYGEYRIALPGGFSLPLALAVETYTQYSASSAAPDAAAGAASLKAFARQYVTDQMVAGTIIDCTQWLSDSGNLLHLRGVYVCTEMIGREQEEQIGEIHGKSG